MTFSRGYENLIKRKFDLTFVKIGEVFIDAIKELKFLMVMG